MDDRAIRPEEERTVFYRIVVYRRLGLTHPIILRVRDYERELVERYEELTGWQCEEEDWDNLVHNLFGRRYQAMMQMAIEGKLIPFMQLTMKEFKDQKYQIIKAVEKEHLRPEPMMYRIQSLSAELASAMVQDQYPDMEPEQFEDLMMPLLVESAQKETMTEEQQRYEYWMERYLAPLPKKITWEYLLAEAREPELPPQLSRQTKETLDLRKIIIIMMTSWYLMRMSIGDQEVPMPEDVLTQQEMDQIELRNELVYPQFEMRLFQSLGLELEQWGSSADEMAQQLFINPKILKYTNVDLEHLMSLPLMNSSNQK